jgi:hypothetical protein
VPDVPREYERAPGTCDDAPAAPSAACFTAGNCQVVTVSTDGLENSDNIVLRYPHDPVRFGNGLYFSVQDESNAGREGGGKGYIFRVDVPSMQGLTRVAGPLDSPALLTARDGYLFYRTALNSDAQVVRLEMATMNEEIVATSSAARIEELFVPSATEVFYRRLQELRCAVRGDSGWQTAPIVSGAGTLAAGFWAMTGADHITRAHAIVGAKLPHLTELAHWERPGAKWIASSCSGTYLYDGQADQPLYRLFFGGASGGGLEGVNCTAGCERREVAAHAVDSKFAYVATPGAAGHLRAVPLAGGAATTLVSGDIWNVTNDDDALYFTDRDGTRVGRIAKH